MLPTDVAARGIDIPGVRHVYNYDLPNVPENYVHRIGRTARAGAQGEAVAFCSPAEMSELKAVEKAIGKKIPVIGGRRWEADEEEAKPKRGGPGRRQQGRGRPGGGGGKNAGPKPSGAKPGGAKPSGAKPGGAPKNRRRRRKGPKA